MTYLDLINDFWDEFENEALRPADALLYLFLLKVCNSKAWENPFELSNRRIRLSLEMTDKTIIESRERLAARGLIKVSKGERNRISPRYTLRHFCFPTESKKGSKRASKKESKTESNSATTTQQKGNKTGNFIIDKDIYCVVVDITRARFFDDFFDESRRSTIEALCMNTHTDEATLRRLAKEVLDDWQATSEPPHHDINEARKHLLSQMRIKLAAERRAQQQLPARTASANRAADKAPRSVNDSWADFNMPTK